MFQIVSQCTATHNSRGRVLGESRGLLQYRYPVIVYQYYLANYLVAGGTGILGGVFNFLLEEKKSLSFLGAWERPGLQHEGIIKVSLIIFSSRVAWYNAVACTVDTLATRMLLSDWRPTMLQHTCSP